MLTVRTLIVAALFLPTVNGQQVPAVPHASGDIQPIDPLAHLEARLDRLEAENRQLMHQLERPQTIIKKDLSPAFIGTNKRTGWIGGVEYLHMAYRQGGLEYGITDVGGVQDRGAVGDVLAMDGDYDQGWRFSLGYRFDADCGCLFDRPELLFSYTNFETDLTETYIGALRSTFISSDNSENNDADDINTLGVETITPDDRATSVTASLNFDYDVYDAELAQSFALTRNASLRLAAIARVAVMDEDFRVTYSGGDFQTPYTAFRNWDYQGAGLLMGSQIDWKVTENLSIGVGGKAGMMLGRRNSRHFFPDDEPGVPTDVTDSITRATAVIEMAAMLNYQRQFDRFTLNVGGGYEFKNWFSMAEDRRFTDSHMEGQNILSTRDLTLDGFVARVSVNY